MHETPTAAEADTLLRVLGGHIYFQALSAALQFDLFSSLEEKGPLDHQQIAQLLHIEEQPCRILLLPLVATGILAKDGAKYSNTRLSRFYLCRQSPKNIIAMGLLEHFLMYKPMFHFFEALKENANVGLREVAGDEPTVYQRLARDPKLEKIFQDAMHNISVQAQDDLSERADFENVKFLIDVGGGNGSNIIRLAKKFPHLKAAVFDLPSVCAIAEKNIAEHGLSSRLSVIPGNCFQDELPRDADCFLFCHFFTIWSKQEDELLLKKAHRALGPGGRAMIFNMMQNNDEDGPLLAAMGSPYFLTLATGRGMLYTWNEYETMFKNAGFARVEHKKLPVDHGVIWGTKS